MQAIQAIAITSFFCLLLLRVESYPGGGDGIQCSPPNCPADCGTTTGPEGCLVCDCSGSVGAVGRPNDDDDDDDDDDDWGVRQVKGCPRIPCFPGCGMLQKPVGCPGCDCPLRNKDKSDNIIQSSRGIRKRLL